MTTATLLSQRQIQGAQAIEVDSIQTRAYYEARINIREGLEEDDTNPMAFLHLGIVNTGLRDILAADSAFDRAEAIYPEYFDEEGGTGAYRLNAWIEA